MGPLQQLVRKGLSGTDMQKYKSNIMHRAKCSDCLVGTVRQAGVGGHHAAFQVSTATCEYIDAIPLHGASAGRERLKPRPVQQRAARRASEHASTPALQCTSSAGWQAAAGPYPWPIHALLRPPLLLPVPP